jgi:hypothetical protein
MVIEEIDWKVNPDWKEGMVNKNADRYQVAKVEEWWITAPRLRHILEGGYRRDWATYLITVLEDKQRIQALYSGGRRVLGMAWGDDDVSWSDVPSLLTGIEWYLFDQPQWKHPTNG